MCGPETTNRPRGGALVALSPPLSSRSPSPSPSPPFHLRGDLSFHTPGSPASTTATHARLTPSEASTNSSLSLSSLFVVIHSSGDLGRDLCDCGLFRQFAFPSATGGDQDDGFVELSLDAPLSLEVGDDGIIGRRVSLYSRPPSGREFVVAEGIVGFNFLRQAEPASP